MNARLCTVTHLPARKNHPSTPPTDHAAELKRFRRSDFAKWADRAQFWLDRVTLEASRDAVDLPEEFRTTTTYMERHPLTWRERYLVDHGADFTADEALCFLAHSARSRTLWKWWNRESTIYSPPDGWTLHELLPGAWMDDDLPAAAMSNKEWIRMFQACGFLSDGPRQPDGPVRVYRAARPEGANGLSWTGSLDVATWYQQNADSLRLQLNYGVPARFLQDRQVYACLVPPERVLARFDDRNEDEYVVDVRGLDISTVSTPTAAA